MIQVPPLQSFPAPPAGEGRAITRAALFLHLARRRLRLASGRLCEG